MDSAGSRTRAVSGAGSEASGLGALGAGRHVEDKVEPSANRGRSATKRQLGTEPRQPPVEQPAGNTAEDEAWQKVVHATPSSQAYPSLVPPKPPTRSDSLGYGPQPWKQRSASASVSASVAAREIAVSNRERDMAVLEAKAAEKAAEKATEAAEAAEKTAAANASLVASMALQMELQKQIAADREEMLRQQMSVGKRPAGDGASTPNRQSSVSPGVGPKTAEESERAKLRTSQVFTPDSSAQKTAEPDVRANSWAREASTPASERAKMVELGWAKKNTEVPGEEKGSQDKQWGPAQKKTREDYDIATRESRQSAGGEQRQSGNSWGQWSEPRQSGKSWGQWKSYDREVEAHQTPPEGEPEAPQTPSERSYGWKRTTYDDKSKPWEPSKGSKPPLKHFVLREGAVGNPALLQAWMIELRNYMELRWSEKEAGLKLFDQLHAHAVLEHGKYLAESKAQRAVRTSVQPELSTVMDRVSREIYNDVAGHFPQSVRNSATTAINFRDVDDGDDCYNKASLADLFYFIRVQTYPQTTAQQIEERAVLKKSLDIRWDSLFDYLRDWKKVVLRFIKNGIIADTDDFSEYYEALKDNVRKARPGQEWMFVFRQTTLAEGQFDEPTGRVGKEYTMNYWRFVFDLTARFHPPVNGQSKDSPLMLAMVADTPPPKPWRQGQPRAHWADGDDQCGSDEHVTPIGAGYTDDECDEWNGYLPFGQSYPDDFWQDENEGFCAHYAKGRGKAGKGTQGRNASGKPDPPCCKDRNCPKPKDRKECVSKGKTLKCSKCDAVGHSQWACWKTHPELMPERFIKTRYMEKGKRPAARAMWTVAEGWAVEEGQPEVSASRGGEEKEEKTAFAAYCEWEKGMQKKVNDKWESCIAQAEGAEGEHKGFGDPVGVTGESEGV